MAMAKTTGILSNPHAGLAPVGASLALVWHWSGAGLAPVWRRLVPVWRRLGASWSMLLLKLFIIIIFQKL
jgi:hypothetical protein